MLDFRIAPIIHKCRLVNPLRRDRDDIARDITARFRILRLLRHLADAARAIVFIFHAVAVDIVHCRRQHEGVIFVGRRLPVRIHGARQAVNEQVLGIGIGHLQRDLRAGFVRYSNCRTIRRVAFDGGEQPLRGLLRIVDKPVFTAYAVNDLVNFD